MERVVITGMGAISPIGNTTETFWNNLINGVSGISNIDSFNTDEYKSKIAGVVKNFDATELLGRKESRKLDRFAQFALVAAEEAWIDSKLEDSEIDPERIGVYIGSGIGGIQSLLDSIDTLRKKGPSRVSPTLVPAMIANAAAAQVSIRFQAMGPSMAPVSACAIGNTAIGEAFKVIQTGEADVIFAGGSEAAITEISLSSFGNAKALSERNRVPAEASRPFDSERDGFVMAEGAGILILESLSSALRRGAHIHGEIIGYGASSDAYHMVTPHPEGKGAFLAMKKALSNANLTIKDIDVISAHATSTFAGDLAETNAIKQLFGDQAYSIPITANKSMLGHMLGAAGGIEAIALINSLNRGIIPPTINLTNPDLQCDLDYTPNVSKKAEMSIGLSNSFGFGGHNAAIIIRKYHS
ncbi:beta-ketoacyl-ACP synthase II [Terribacillus saccharophilus]|uniref:3-oxoacyl-[acyl-carrier-protein] synthase 2 n=1 Tax=Terribacillus saccharophilus TaxID=361277 RepID=A0AAX2EDQ3_9BACI|nr:beta-ketoacyl-ACP synthase II [Terribacillus goriensis]SEM85895.1 3-oxoacyl-[acyl-carrier-protein] synthase II [Terribacillus saccharophilus]